jgi:hypothetical protein
LPETDAIQYAKNLIDKYWPKKLRTATGSPDGEIEIRHFRGIFNRVKRDLRRKFNPTPADIFRMCDADQDKSVTFSEAAQCLANHLSNDE